MLEIYYQNVRGLRSKTNEVFTNILNSNYKVIALTETWLNSSIYSKELFDNRYVVYRRDRLCSQIGKQDGGGVLIAISRELSSSRIVNWESDIESLWVVIEINIQSAIRKIAICVVYLPPPVKIETLNKFLESVDNVINHVEDIIVLGDFNMGFINWKVNDNFLHTTPSNCTSTLGYSLIDFLCINRMHQYNCIKNCNDKVLDLVFSNLSNISVRKPLDLLSRLDPFHPNLLIVICNTHVPCLQSKCHPRYNYFKADYELIVNELKSIDWFSKFSACNNVNAMVAIFYNRLFNVIEKFVPLRKLHNARYPVWFSKNLIRLLAEKDKIRAKFNKYKNPRDKLEFKILRKRCHKLLSNCYAEYISRTQNNIRIKPRAFWSFIKDKRDNESSVPASMKLGNVMARSGHEIASLFAIHFSSVFTQDNNASLTGFSNPNIPQIGKIEFNESEILKFVKSLDIQKGAGPDNLPPLFVRRCGPAIAFPLTLIFNRSLSEGVFPDEWKKARIVPVHKKGDRMDVQNYRPISILSCFSKLFEKIVYPIMSNHLERFLTWSQHGFRKGFSVQTNLSVFVSDLSRAIDRGQEVDAIYTDFSSAFDKVNHTLLLDKLGRYGVGGSILEWFKSYLSRRPQSVAIKGFESNTYLASSGVPQGSHLGPLLFLVFINDITNEIKHCKISLFADDLKIYRTIKNNVDAGLVQKDLNAIFTWCQTNSMTLNVNKCFFIKYSRKKKPLVSNYLIGNKPLKEVSEIRDLGVIIDKKLTFRSHVDKVVAKAARVLGFIRRNSNGFSQGVKIVLYNALVRSLLEYASVIWSPTFNVHSQRVESIQRTFTRHLAFSASGISHRRPYCQRLAWFGMMSLRNRRTLLDMCFLHKILSQDVRDSNLVERISLSVPRRYPRNKIHNIFHIPISKTRMGNQAPVVRLCANYNRIVRDLPGIDIFGDSFTMFKKKLVHFLK
ncbi:unnamed protein product [Euphydryas editha]|uniref:Reverse transcriptase domain-containing protein n=1 Tax=Euphydryas editha TaxID=104508 RepID=A0AAU9TET5_EUPED|nr:unnamed protein product [Euphydryas editha]